MSAQWPEWFHDKYGEHLNIGRVLSSKHEIKRGALYELEKDIQTVLIEINYNYHRRLTWMGEDGATTTYRISPTEITETWKSS